MNSCSPKVQWLVWGLLAIVIAAIGAAYLRSERTPPLPTLGEVRSFSLTNQSGGVTTAADLKGKVWLANVIFTRCAGPCERLTRDMKQIQSALQDRQDEVSFLSLTADPEHDTPEVFRKYAADRSIPEANWHFVSSDKPTLYTLATKQFLFVVVENTDRKPDEDLFIHSTRFAVIDREGRIRAYVDGGETNSVQDAVAALRRLLKEPKR